MRFEEVMALDVRKLEINFGKGKDAIKKGLSALIRDWHPDVSSHPKAREALAHITYLRRIILSGSVKPKIDGREFTRSDGSKFVLRPLSTFSQESCEVIVCQNSVSRLFPQENEDLSEASVINIEEFRFADAAMEKQMRSFLPPVPKVTTLLDGSVMLTFPRRKDLLPLADLIREKGPFDAKTGAWVISGMMNMACWLEWGRGKHGAISPETIMVSPEFHEVHLDGGWEFASYHDDSPLALPASTLRLFPELAMPGTTLPAELDRSLIRETAMRLLGAHSVSALLSGSTPKSIANWIVFPHKGTAVQDYVAWKEALREAYGDPKFVDMGVTAEQVYSKY